MRLLCRLRWLAVLGQVVTVLLVTGPMQVPLAPAPLWIGVAALTAFNLYASWRATRGREPGPAELFAHLLADIVVLTWMVAWSGGIENPFASLFLLPIALSILALPARWLWATTACAVLGFAISVVVGRPLPHVHAMMGDAFDLHKAGMLVSFAISAVVLLVFFTRLATISRAREQELAALRERFARNEGIVALATHAASVAHELNTPLATLTLMADELPDEGDRDQMLDLIAQCRDRVRALAAPAEQGLHGTPVDLEEVIDRWKLVRPAVELRRLGELAAGRVVDPAVGHLLQALLNNAADAGEQAGVPRVDLLLEIRDGQLSGEIRDYGAGFGKAVPILPATLFRTNKPDGLGIGLALSHATVERLGGELSMQATSEGSGVRVLFRLPETVLA
jgi:two-component system sensor histidine kinase RegB